MRRIPSQHRVVFALAVATAVAIGTEANAAVVNITLFPDPVGLSPNQAFLANGDTLTFTCDIGCSNVCFFADGMGSIEGISPIVFPTVFAVPGNTTAPLGPATGAGTGSIQIEGIDSSQNCGPTTSTLSSDLSCGNGFIDSPDQCDDGNTSSGDGCSIDDTSYCRIEPGYICVGEPSVCTFCGDGIIKGTEQCDDSGTTPGDGCDASCQIEIGFSCEGEPSVCSEIPVPALSPLGLAMLCSVLGLASWWKLRAWGPENSPCR